MREREKKEKEERVNLFPDQTRRYLPIKIQLGLQNTHLYQFQPPYVPRASRTDPSLYIGSILTYMYAQTSKILSSALIQSIINIKLKDRFSNLSVQLTSSHDSPADRKCLNTCTYTHTMNSLEKQLLNIQSNTLLKLEFNFITNTLYGNRVNRQIKL